MVEHRAVPGTVQSVSLSLYITGGSIKKESIKKEQSIFKRA